MINLFEGYANILSKCSYDKINTDDRHEVMVNHENIYLSTKQDSQIGMYYEGLQRWSYNSQESYTDTSIVHSLNYFMIHLVDGYLQTGEY